MANNVTNNPPAVSFDYTTAQNLSNIAMGLGAEFTGQPYDIYRITASSNGDVIQPANKILSGYPIVRQNYKPIKGTLNRLETDKAFTTLWENVQADCSVLLTGDILYQNDPVYGKGATAVNFATDQFNALCFGAQPPGGTPLGARVDRKITIWRVPDLPIDSNYFDTTFNGALPLQIVAGLCKFGANHLATPAKIPAGFLPEKRARGMLYQDLGDVPPKVTTKLYVMPLPGFRFRAGDRIVAEDKSRYVVTNAFYQDTGAVGSQLIVEREVEND